VLFKCKRTNDHLLSVCCERVFTQVGNSLKDVINPSLIDIWIRNFELGVKSIVNSIPGVADILYLEPKTSTIAILAFNDSYEALILALHLGGMYYLHDELICYVPDITTAVSYAYGIRNLVKDVIGFKDLVKRVKYLLIHDSRRGQGDVKAILTNAARNFRLDPYEAVLIRFEGLGEGFYEALGAFILRNEGYIVFHQGLASHASTPIVTIPGVPDIELTKGVTSRGYFAYELRIAKELKRELSLSIGNVDVKNIISGAGEVKGSSYDFSRGLHQILGYLDSGLYDEGYLILPGIAGDESRLNMIKDYGLGLVTWDNEGKPYIVKPSKSYSKYEKAYLLKRVIKDLILTTLNPLKL